MRFPKIDDDARTKNLKLDGTVTKMCKCGSVSFTANLVCANCSEVMVNSETSALSNFSNCRVESIGEPAVQDEPETWSPTIVSERDLAITISFIFFMTIVFPCCLVVLRPICRF